MNELGTKIGMGVDYFGAVWLEDEMKAQEIQEFVVERYKRLRLNGKDVTVDLDDLIEIAKLAEAHFGEKPEVAFYYYKINKRIRRKFLVRAKQHGIVVIENDSRLW
ncbi:hypothetical protein HDU96_007395 [Phlyctochytrium bullatum]|nr:hypothetical protein HDU96_007395 [Phlyctochytrium bullatum]